MSNPKPYADIGPFKGVPTNLLVNAALRANSAYEVSASALARHAKTIDDDVGKSFVIHQSVAKANAAWKSVEARTDVDRVQATSDYHTSLFPVALFVGLGLVAIVSALITGKPPIASLALPMFMAAAVTVAVTYLSFGRLGRAALREIREQGYSGDLLPVAMEHIAGHCLRVGNNGLHVATKQANGKATVKTVYWDGMGHALVEVDEMGLERVDIYGREGTLVDSITSPTAVDGKIDARGLADLVNQRIAAARKTA
ncbi:hypothetical protein [Rhizobium sp. BK176]|uniref:hypothetical protein n=1 Tax=Rhizobium sp. BK176 TaxID=2587071 RepID=UPI0021678DCA|nr:hypothetical protein [Rhizobium sp. BK176]MCS4089469.1 hypothetical protein [Rhizobium sp. BK176]